MTHLISWYRPFFISENPLNTTIGNNVILKTDMA